jgi:FolB domain-containing protein
MQTVLSSHVVSDAIVVRGLELSSWIGVPDIERAEAQRLTIDLVVLPSEPLLRLEDDIARTVDYFALTRRVRQVAAERPRRLVETLAEEICTCVLTEFSVRVVEVELKKYILPDAEYVAVRLCRESTQK